MTPIVLIPGLLCTAEAFAPQAAALWPYGPVTIANTLQGETMAEIARNILATAPPRFALGGISMGGYLCFEILRQAPQRVIKLALLDTTARPDTPEQTAQRNAMLEGARAGHFEMLARAALKAIMHPAHQDDAALAAINLRMAQTVGVEGFARQTAAIIARPDSRPMLAAIAVPTVMIVGADDLLTPPDRAQEIAAAIPNARLVVVPECGHSSTLEQPEAVSRVLVEWIRA
jgi:pimeloyl-ACP methyl ester carboxylesterase